MLSQLQSMKSMISIGLLDFVVWTRKYRDFDKYNLNPLMFAVERKGLQNEI